MYICKYIVNSHTNAHLVKTKVKDCEAHFISKQAGVS